MATTLSDSRSDSAVALLTSPSASPSPIQTSSDPSSATTTTTTTTTKTSTAPAGNPHPLAPMLNLPPELIHLIISFCDLPTLDALSATSTYLRTLSLRIMRETGALTVRFGACDCECEDSVDRRIKCLMEKEEGRKAREGPVRRLTLWIEGNADTYEVVTRTDAGEEKEACCTGPRGTKTLEDRLSTLTELRILIELHHLPALPNATATTTTTTATTSTSSTSPAPAAPNKPEPLSLTTLLTILLSHLPTTHPVTLHTASLAPTYTRRISYEHSTPFRRVTYPNALILHAPLPHSIHSVFLTGHRFQITPRTEAVVNRPPRRSSSSSSSPTAAATAPDPTFPLLNVEFETQVMSHFWLRSDHLPNKLHLEGLRLSGRRLKDTLADLLSPHSSLVLANCALHPARREVTDTWHYVLGFWSGEGGLVVGCVRLERLVDYQNEGGVDGRVLRWYERLMEWRGDWEGGRAEGGKRVKVE